MITLVWDHLSDVIEFLCLGPICDVIWQVVHE